MATNLTRRGRTGNNPALLPALPDEQGIADPAMRLRFQMIREWLEVRLGARGDFYERAVTHRELEAQLAQIMADPGVSDEDKRLLGLLNQLGSQLQGLVRQVSLVQSILNQTIDNSNTAITNIYNQVRDVAVEDVTVWARDMLPSATGGCSALTVIEFDPAQPNFHALLFDPTTDESAEFNAMLPFSWAGRMFRVYVYWGHGGGGADWDVTWEVTANSTSDNETVILDFVGGAVITDTGGTAGNLYIAALSGAVPIASNVNRDGDMVSLRIYRRPTHADDTMDIDAALLAVRFTLSDVPFPDPSYDPYWADVVLLLHGDGTDGSTTIIDSSSFAQTVTITGASTISTAASKFGGSSLKGAASSYYEVVLGSDGVFAGDFTIEMWVQQGANNVVFTSGTGIYLYNALFYYTGANSPSMAAGNTSTSSTWAHFAISRTAGVLKTFKEGLEQASISYSTTMDFSTMRFGYYQPNGNLHYQHYLDDIRVTKNVGRYTTDFTPPTAAFPDY